MSGVNILVILLIIGVVAGSNLIVTATCLLLILKFANIRFVFSLLERRGLELGLLFLLLSVLVPLANGQISNQDILGNITSLTGILAIAGGALATSLNTWGVKYLKEDPEIVFGLITGSILGVVLLHGVPVGPLMAAGIAAMFSRAAARIRG